MSQRNQFTRANKRLRRARLKAQDQQAQELRLVDAKVQTLTCDHAAVDELSVLCGSAYEHAGYDVDTVVAAEHLWRRAAPEHALTATLTELRLELERHREVMIAFVVRFDAMLAGTAPHAHDHRHLEPNADDLRRIRFSVLGDDDREHPPSQPD